MNMQEEADDLEELIHPRHFGLEQAIFIIMLLLSLLGMVVTDFSRHDGYGYWLIMVLVFGVLSIFVSWLQSKRSEIEFGDIVKEQASHWLLTLLIVVAAFLVQKSGQLTETSASLVILLLLAMATMLDGKRIGWQFTLIGFYLAGSAIIIAYVEAFIWACGGLGVAVIIGTFLWKKWVIKYRDNNED
ncbi:hypothetical protein NP590_04405 [Methylomonas sp. SURF-2]|uniref:DUF2157 domain-containing protein n=1 Tax=Methylomonas subterranea TaxID=2952225 RepID=A0ABT1TD16_9GAMM|nr:hypothetical protein [Methylomonas sp. SURF-2]MCQ8103340.1 hypothetical protein [Methylomonas sp. SURF-2]